MDTLQVDVYIPVGRMTGAYNAFSKSQETSEKVCQWLPQMGLNSQPVDKKKL